jgi:hypothetical protein
MTRKTQNASNAVVTDCQGSKKLSVVVEVLPSNGTAGLIGLDDVWYFLERRGPHLWNLKHFRSGGGAAYQIRTGGHDGVHCDCPDFKFRSGIEKRPCKHLQAAQVVLRILEIP